MGNETSVDLEKFYNLVTKSSWQFSSSLCCGPKNCVFNKYNGTVRLVALTTQPSLLSLYFVPDVVWGGRSSTSDGKKPKLGLLEVMLPNLLQKLKKWTWGSPTKVVVVDTQTMHDRSEVVLHLKQETEPLRYILLFYLCRSKRNSPKGPFPMKKAIDVARRLTYFQKKVANINVVYLLLYLWRQIGSAYRSQ